MTKIIKHISIISFLFFFSNTILAQVQAQNNKKSTSKIIGEWEGNLTINKEKTVGILWRFTETEHGKITGFMGPVSKGIASIPMQNIIIKDNTLKFKIHSQGSFSGQIYSKEIKGTWFSISGKELNLYMARELSKKQLNKRFNTTNSKKDIFQSVKIGDLDDVINYLKKGNNIDKKHANGKTLLMSAIKNDRTFKIVPFLLKNGANPNLDIDGISPLMYAIAYQNLNAAKSLIKYKAATNFINKRGESALVFAIKGRNPKAIQLLLNNGANPKLPIHNNYSAIDLAKEENIKEVLDVFKIPYQGINDGPYISNSNIGKDAVWISKSKIHKQQINVAKTRNIKFNGTKTILWKDTPKEVEKLVYNGNFKIGAISDIHGQYDTFIKLLKNNNVINQQKKWNFGKGHFVIAGDIFDRGPNVTEVLWFLYDLEKQAEKSGGKLHVLLGNHDVMVLNGNLRSVHPKYNEVAKILNKPFQTLFNKGTVLGDWIRTRPVIVKINNILFTHGGLHPDLANKKLSIHQINSVFKQQLIERELTEKRSELGNYLHRGNGPIYYRGYFQGKKATMEEINKLLAHFKINTIVVGHTTHRQIESRYDGKVIVVDANMKSGAMGEMLLWNTGEFVRKTLTGKQLPLQNN